MNITPTSCCYLLFVVGANLSPELCALPSVPAHSESRRWKFGLGEGADNLSNGVVSITAGSHVVFTLLRRCRLG